MSRTKRHLPDKSYRHIRTNNERRQIDSSLDQDVKVRAKRNKRHLPDAWDDRPINSYKQCVRGSYKNGLRAVNTKGKAPKWIN